MTLRYRSTFRKTRDVTYDDYDDLQDAVGEVDDE